MALIAWWRGGHGRFIGEIAVLHRRESAFAIDTHQPVCRRLHFDPISNAIMYFIG
jgi:hypothetical protein